MELEHSSELVSFAADCNTRAYVHRLKIIMRFFSPSSFFVVVVESWRRCKATQVERASN